MSSGSSRGPEHGRSMQTYKLISFTGIRLGVSPYESKVMIMKTGIIGAGKVGLSLGKYFVLHGLDVTGYYDVDREAAKEAAEFTGTVLYYELDRLARESDTLFLTVPDGLIATVWDQIKDMSLQGKFICHCSGALSAGEAFPGIDERGAFGYSIHPLFAVSDKYNSYKELSHAYFTIEGNELHLDEVAGWFRGCGNQVRFIQASDKVKYHLAAAVCSNHVVAVIAQSLKLMEECGFDEDSALAALRPLMAGNMDHIVRDGVTKSLTGPVERADAGTVRKHLSVLNENDRQLYKLLSAILVSVGKKKNPGRDYSAIEEIVLH